MEASAEIMTTGLMRLTFWLLEVDDGPVILEQVDFVDVREWLDLSKLS